MPPSGSRDHPCGWRSCLPRGIATPPSGDRHVSAEVSSWVVRVSTIAPAGHPRVTSEAWRYPSEVSGARLRGRTRSLPREPPRRMPDHAPERLAEGALRLVAERRGDRRHRLVGGGESLGGEEHAPARQVLRGGLSDDLLEAEREDGAGHTRAAGELLQRP